MDPDEIYETYPTENPRKITMTYTAAGPMWNSSMVVTLPEALDAIVPDAKNGDPGYLRVTNRGGSDIDFDINTNVAGTDNNQITIPIDVMNTNQGVEIIYYSRYEGTAVVANTTADTAFGVTTDTSAAQDSSAPLTVSTGKLRRKDGSGTLMVTPMYVEIADDNEVAELENFTLTYEAKTKLEHATLTIAIPRELTGVLDSEDSPLDTDTVAENDPSDTDGDQSTDLMNIARNVVGTSSDTRNRTAAGFVYSPDRHSAPANLEVTGGNTIMWHDLNINAGQRFRTIIRVDISQTVDDDGEHKWTRRQSTPVLMTVDDGVYPFNTSVDTPRRHWRNRY